MANDPVPVVFQTSYVATSDHLSRPMYAARYDVQKMIVAGDPNGSPSDSPANRVDPNTASSDFSGVGSLSLGGGLCTGTPISFRHVLTAAHCLDQNNNGTIDVTPAQVTFFLNYGSDRSHSIGASALFVHPDWTGFANPVVNDDVAVVELSAPLPAGVPIYPLNTDAFVNVETLTLVGYGRSGTGVSGYTTGASFTVKRSGQNHANLFVLDDEGSGAREGFELDFDGPTAATNAVGGLTLGNDVETTLGGGDSGGPSFIDDGGVLKVFGINTYTFSFNIASAPLFGSGAGGMVVAAYADFIQSIIGGPGVTILETGGSTDLSEAGATDTYEVVLDEAPTDDVRILLNPDSQVTTSPAELVFTSSNWSTSQPVTVSAVEDSTPEGFHTGTIAHTASSSDDNYDGISIASVTANITDNDALPVVFYFSLTNSATLPGVSGTVQDEDIVAYNGVDFSLVFDGSDVGVGSMDINAFSMQDDGSILMSFTSGSTIGSLGSVDDSDIVRFQPTQLGAATSGDFAFHFDGSDVGLSSSGEDIDGLDVLGDGTLLISTTGGISVSGVSGSDEDLTAFSPLSLGTTTAGTWTTWFDGSDVGLANSRNEDVDAAAVGSDGKYYFSTVGDFTVSGASGADEDVFSFSAVTTGSNTSGSFAPFVDGSTISLSGEDINAVDFPGGPAGPTNEAPVASNDDYSTNEDEPLVVNAPGILSNDSDGDQDPLTAVFVSSTSLGTLDPNSDGSFTYTPTANLNGADTFTYKAHDGTTDSNLATVSITVNPVNDPPVANNQTVAVKQETLRAITVTASDVDGDSLTYSVVAGPSHGVLSGDGPQFSYTPDDGFTGPDSFTFRANDGTADSNTASVSITVAANNAPVANAQSVTTAEDTARAIVLTGSDPDGDPLSFSVEVHPAKGDLSGTAPNLMYTPHANDYGSDSFTFKVNDGTEDSPLATVSITVTAENDPPVANSQSVTTDEDTAADITLTGSDLDGDTLTYSIVSGPSSGTLTGSGANQTYTPNNNFNGSDSFTFRVNDGSANSPPATVSITVTPVNDRPQGSDDSYSLTQDTTLNVPAPGVLENDADVDDDPLMAVLHTQPANGDLTPHVNGSFSYTPDPGFDGVDSFSYRASDGVLTSDLITVSLTINRPVAGPQLAHGVTIVGTSWTTVNLPYSYSQMVVVGTPNYDSGSGPAVVRIQNAVGSSFQVRVAPAGPNPTALAAMPVHWVAVEAGVYDVPGSYRLEAGIFESTITDENNSWSGKSMSYQQSYSAPAVFAQVMTHNDSRWSVAWTAGSSRTSPPSGSVLKLGKHTGEDPNPDRANEDVGYIVVEANGSGTAEIDGLPYVAGLGGDSIRGVDNSPPYSYGYAAMANSKTAIVTQAGMDGANGGWAFLYGSNPITPTGSTLKLAIDEDQSRDAERRHTTEQVAYWVIDPPLVSSTTAQLPARDLLVGPFVGESNVSKSPTLDDQVTVARTEDVHESRADDRRRRLAQPAIDHVLARWRESRFSPEDEARQPELISADLISSLGDDWSEGDIAR